MAVASHYPRRNWYLCPQPHLRHPSSRFNRSTSPVHVFRVKPDYPDNTTFRTMHRECSERGKSSNQVPIDDSREEAVLKEQDMGSFRSRSCIAQPVCRFEWWLTMTMTTMPTTVIWMTLSDKSSALHAWLCLLSILISLLSPSTPTSILIALTLCPPPPPYPLPSPLLLLLLLLGSPCEVQEFTIIIIFSPYWWLSWKKSLSLSLRANLQSAMMASFTLLVPTAVPLAPSAPSSPFFPFRRSDPPFFTPARSEYCILPYFSARLPSLHSLRCLGSSLWRSGSSLRRSSSPQKAFSTPVSRLTPTTLGLHPCFISPCVRV